jgi:hypothetical protein
MVRELVELVRTWFAGLFLFFHPYFPYVFPTCHNDNSPPQIFYLFLVVFMGLTVYKFLGTAQSRVELNGFFKGCTEDGAMSE